MSNGGRVEEGGGEERASRAGAPQAATQPQMRQLRRTRTCSFFSPHCSIHVARGARLRRRSWSAGDAQCLLTSRPLCLCVCDSDPGAAVRVHQLLDLRLRLLQRHPVSAALPFPAPTTGFRTPVLLSTFSVVILSRLLGWECDLQCAFIQTALLVSVQCQSLWRLHSFATLMGIDVAVFKTSEFELF